MAGASEQDSGEEIFLKGYFFLVLPLVLRTLQPEWISSARMMDRGEGIRTPTFADLRRMSAYGKEDIVFLHDWRGARNSLHNAREDMYAVRLGSASQSRIQKYRCFIGAIQS